MAAVSTHRRADVWSFHVWKKAGAGSWQQLEIGISKRGWTLFFNIRRHCGVGNEVQLADKVQVKSWRTSPGLGDLNKDWQVFTERRSTSVTRHAGELRVNRQRQAEDLLAFGKYLRTKLFAHIYNLAHNRLVRQPHLVDKSAMTASMIPTNGYVHIWIMCSNFKRGSSTSSHGLRFKLTFSKLPKVESSCRRNRVILGRGFPSKRLSPWIGRICLLVGCSPLNMRVHPSRRCFPELRYLL